MARPLLQNSRGRLPRGQEAPYARIVKNTAVSADRSAARLKRDPGNWAFEDLLPLPEETSDQQLERAEHERLVLAAIELLPESQRQAVDLLRAGNTCEEIATRLGCSLGAVRMRLQRAREELDRVLRQTDASLAEAGY